jgi:hypothetical protein
MGSGWVYMVAAAAAAAAAAAPCNGGGLPRPESLTLPENQRRGRARESVCVRAQPLLTLDGRRSVFALPLSPGVSRHDLKIFEPFTFAPVPQSSDKKRVPERSDGRRTVRRASESRRQKDRAFGRENGRKRDGKGGRIHGPRASVCLAAVESCEERSHEDGGKDSRPARHELARMLCPPRENSHPG